MSSDRKISFSIKRPDLIYDFASSLDDIFRFRHDDGEPFSSETSVRLQESFGFDFKGETNPIVQIAPPAQVLESLADLNSKDFSVFISIEDTALGMREVVYQKPVAHIQELETVRINLSDFEQMGFVRGYVIRCFMTRTESEAPHSSLVWSKSNIICTSEFICKASVEDALFEIAWTTFNDPDMRKNVLIYVDWKSNDVSYSPHSECFQVKANNDLKPQFKRLENNSHFGELSIRLIADRIVAELAEAALRCADLEGGASEGSLHEKLELLFEAIGLEFSSLAQRYQAGDTMDQLLILSEVNRSIQRSHKIAATLSGIKFGGYRLK
jgi:hypothetical protein